MGYEVFLSIIMYALLALCALAFMLFKTAFLWWGTRLAKIKDQSFGKALSTSLPGYVAAGAIIFALWPTPIYALAAGLIAGCITDAFCVMAFYETSIRKAIIASMFSTTLAITTLEGLFFLVSQ